MEQFHTVAAVRDFIRKQKHAGKRISFVPTMGALHGGHRSCIDVARSRGDVLVVSIFLNPTQFGPSEDLSRYPADLDRDMELCRSWGVDAVFVPSGDEMYPEPQTAWVDVEGLTHVLCGRTRPGHFRGVTTVVAKLFHAVEPDVAVFGQKDAQQALVIRAMVQQLAFPVELALSPIVREDDGLAISSRNAYLSAAERQLAPALQEALQEGVAAVKGGERKPGAICQAVADTLSARAVTVEYVELLDTKTLTEPGSIEGQVLLAAAIHVGATRLIDNIVLDVSANGAVQPTLLF
jgi:pantoate--beta-alanine ligase